MSKKIRVGSTVVLKTGGPLMTVSEIDKKLNNTECKWFIDSTLYTGYFSTGSLKRKKYKGK